VGVVRSAVLEAEYVPHFVMQNEVLLREERFGLDEDVTPAVLRVGVTILIMPTILIREGKTSIRTAIIIASAAARERCSDVIRDGYLNIVVRARRIVRLEGAHRDVYLAVVKTVPVLGGVYQHQ
jgi:hypothetical protein